MKTMKKTINKLRELVNFPIGVRITIGFSTLSLCIGLSLAFFICREIALEQNEALVEKVESELSHIEEFRIANGEVIPSSQVIMHVGNTISAEKYRTNDLFVTLFSILFVLSASCILMLWRLLKKRPNPDSSNKELFYKRNPDLTDKRKNNTQQ